MTIVEAIKEVLGNVPQGLTVDAVYDRISSQGLYPFKAVEPKSVVRSQLRRHCLGLDFATASPVKYFRLSGDDHYTLASRDGVRSQHLAVPSIAPAGALPDEVIENAYKEHLSILRRQLKEQILQHHPAFFEELVIKLLLKMGYGGNDPELGVHTGGPSDGGIDGIIKEDKLGLDQIYIQAKRYAITRSVTREDVQRFAGAMNKVQKGVFITTATFSRKARDFATTHQKTISLINGDMLCDLMIKHGIGVSIVKDYQVLRVDSDFFPTDES